MKSWSSTRPTTKGTSAVRVGVRLPPRERFDVLVADAPAVEIAQHRFEQDAQAHRQARNPRDPLLLEQRERVIGAGWCGQGLQTLAEIEHVGLPFGGMLRVVRCPGPLVETLTLICVRLCRCWQRMDMDLLTRMLFENADGALFVRGGPCAYPQQKAAMIHLLLQMVGMVLADPLGQDRA